MPITRSQARLPTSQVERGRAMSSMKHDRLRFRLASVLAVFFFTLSTCPVGSLLAAVRSPETNQPPHIPSCAVPESRSDPMQEETDSRTLGNEVASVECDPGIREDGVSSVAGETAEPREVEEVPEDTNRAGSWKYFVGGALLVVAGILILASGGKDEPVPSEEQLPEFPEPPVRCQN